MAFSARDVTTFAGGALAGLFAAKLLQPLVGQATGRAQARLGADPLDRLDQDHRFVAGLLSGMAETGSALQRRQMLFRLKRALAAHAQAEENALYPLLHDGLGEVELANRLYAGHAAIKMRLHGLEEIGAGSVAWREGVNVLSRAVETHVREETRAFGLVRKALDRGRLTHLAGLLSREREMIL